MKRAPCAQAPKMEIELQVRVAWNCLVEPNQTKHGRSIRSLRWKKGREIKKKNTIQSEAICVFKLQVCNLSMFSSLKECCRVVGEEKREKKEEKSEIFMGNAKSEM